ncbi:hypothetical protein BVRB_6g146410 [Beta vulgaris subsp. vulgaris]|nr:hypothetical protein BVRB_6g146410 [Beta vulgaris subsp. vulgaris]
MKVKTPNLLKKIIAAFSSKTNELRIRIMIFFLLHKNIDKASLTHSLQALVSHQPHQKKKNDEAFEEEEGSKGNLLMSYNKATSMMASHANDMSLAKDVPRPAKYEANDQEDDEQEEQAGVDLTYEIFKELEAEMEDERESKEFVKGGEERLMVDGVVVEEEEDIDQAADLFIQRFKKQMQLQKQRSLERQQWLLLTNA